MFFPVPNGLNVFEVLTFLPVVHLTTIEHPKIYALTLDGYGKVCTLKIPSSTLSTPHFGL